MQKPRDDRQTPAAILRRITLTAALVAAAIGICALAGWTLGIQWLKNLGQPVATNPMVALGLIALGTSIWLRRRQVVGKAARLAAQVVALTVATVGGLRLFEYLAGGGPQIDALLFASKLQGNVIAPNTALCLLLLGSAVATLDLRPRGGRSPAAVLALCSGVIALSAILGYGLAILSMYRLGQYIAMALNTAVGLLALSIAVLCARPMEGPIATAVRSWTLQRTIISAFAVSMFMLCVIGFGAYQSTSRLIAGNLVDEAMQAETLELSDLLSSVKDAETGQRGYLLTGDERYLKPYDDAVTRLDQHLVALRRSTVEKPDHRARLAAVEPLIVRKLSELDRTIRLRRTRGFEAAIQVVRSDQGKLLMDQIRSIVTRMRDEDIRLTELRHREQDAMGRQAVRTIWFGTLMTFVLVVLAGILIRQGIRSQAAAREQLAESDQRFRQLADNIREVFWLTSINGDQIIYMSPAYEVLFARSRGSLEENPRDWAEAVHPDDRERVMTAFLATGLRGTFDEQYRIVRPDGSMRWIHARGTPIRNSRGEAYRIAGIAEDITDQKSVQEVSQRARDAAEAANHSKSEFLANMSHEIRTPMSAILGYADMLMDPQLTPSDRLDHVHTIRRNADHLLKVLNDILDISKIEAGKLQVERIAANPRQIVTDVLSLMRVRAVEKGITVDVTYAGAIPRTIQTDPTRLRQILINLVGNAIKFTESGGVNLVVTLARDHPDDSRLEFSVIDSGIGMTDEQMKQLFKPFEQADSSTTRRFGGTGLGLTICRRLAQMLGGDIAVQSRPGAGSKFVLTIQTGSLDGVPLLSESREPLSPPEPRRSVPQEIRLVGRILLAEDGVHNQKVISYYVKKAGAEVTVAGDGRAACQIATEAIEKGHPFDAILMDMQMPELDGYTAAATLRSRGYRGPIIALTAHAMSHDRAKCLQSGCTDYLSKPVDRDLLVSTLATHLSVSSGLSTAASRPTRQAPPPRDPLPSTLPDEPELRAFLPTFVADLPAMVAQLAQLLNEQNLDELQRVVHKLKGSGGFYGFMPLTEAAERLEARIISAPHADSVADEIQSLIELVRSVEGYEGSREATAETRAEGGGQ